MAAGPAIEMWSKQTGAAEQSPDGRTRTVTMVSGFTVTIDPSDALEVAYTASGLPLVGSLYPGTHFVVCQRLVPQRLAPSLVLITAEYSGEIGSSGEGSSPVDNEIVITWRSAVTDEAIDQDINGKPIVTVNNEPIEGITERIPDMVATIDRNFATINVPALTTYLKSRNSDVFLGWPIGTARFMGYSATQVIANGSASFWKVSAEFQFREPYNTTAAKAWWKRVRHEGYMVKSGSRIIHAVDENKQNVTRPVLLKADGTLETNPNNAHWLEFETTNALPYAALGLTT